MPIIYQSAIYTLRVPWAETVAMVINLPNQIPSLVKPIELLVVTFDIQGFR